MTVNDFLTEYIEGYLISDLKTMLVAEAEVPPHKDGHLGYPMFMTCAAGIETLGMLLHETGKDFENSGQGFNHYWREYLYRDSPRRNVGVSIYQLVRNGIAHNYAAKYPTITTRSREYHLKLVEGVPNVDATTLTKDFIDSYEFRFKPDLSHNMDALRNTFERLKAWNEGKVQAHRASLDHLQVLKKPPELQTSLTGSFSGGTR